MLDIHDAHHAATTWRDFFIHLATIILGLLIAIGLEQTVEYFHHRHLAHEARESIQQELADNQNILQKNLRQNAADQQQLAKDLDLLNSGASGAEVLPHLEYSWHVFRPHDAAWSAAKINGSLALIPSKQITDANYFYMSDEDLTPTAFAYFTDIDTASAIVDHAGRSGKLTAAERQQLVSLTASAMGLARLLSQINSYQLEALQSHQLQ